MPSPERGHGRVFRASASSFSRKGRSEQFLLEKKAARTVLILRSLIRPAVFVLLVQLNLYLLDNLPYLMPGAPPYSFPKRPDKVIAQR